MAEAKEEELETKQELSLVCPSSFVYSHPGDEVVLWCRLDPAVSAVSMEIKWWIWRNMLCHYKDGEMIVNPDYKGRVSLSVEDLHNGNVSLTLKDVTISQRGRYMCEVIHGCRTVEKNIFLSVGYFESPFSHFLSAHPGEDVILPVHLSSETSAASVNFRWFRGTELIYEFKNGQEEKHSAYENRVSLPIQELERGNLSLTLKNVHESDSGGYTFRGQIDGHCRTEFYRLQVRGGALRRRKSFEDIRPDLEGQSKSPETGQTTEAAGQSSTTDEELSSLQMERIRLSPLERYSKRGKGGALRRRISFEHFHPDLEGQSTSPGTGQIKVATGQSSTTDRAKSLLQIDRIKFSPPERYRKRVEVKGQSTSSETGQTTKAAGQSSATDEALGRLSKLFVGPTTARTEDPPAVRQEEAEEDTTTM